VQWAELCSSLSRRSRHRRCALRSGSGLRYDERATKRQRVYSCRATADTRGVAQEGGVA
jgi:hypothetical protein